MKQKPFLFFDIDGTLVDIQTKQIPQSARLALERLLQNGFPLAIASGRAACFIPKDIMNLAPWKYYILGSGHEIRDENFNTVYRRVFPPELVFRCLEIAHRNKVSLELKNGQERFLTEPPNEAMRNAFQNFREGFPPVAPYLGQEITSMTCYSDTGSNIEEFDRMPELEMLYGRTSYCDIVMAGTSKVSAIRAILSREHVTKFVAIGDSLNDMYMVRDADFGIAMGNGCEEIKEVADFVTKPVMDDGLSVAAEKIMEMEW